MKREFQRYEACKDSGIEWIGEIPEHWNIKRIKDISYINKKTLTEKTSKDYEFDYIDISSVTYGVRGFISERMKFGNAPSRAKRVVEKGDTIISTVRTYLKAVTSFEDEISNVIVSTGFAVVSPKKFLSSKYFSYLATSNFLIDKICSLSVGVSYPATNASVIADLLCLVPPMEEQEAIAHYLDTKTAQIDRKIDLLTQKAQRYEELKRSLINETVTRGLDKSVPMKDSGIEWIGEIPDHWEVERINDIAIQQKIKNVGLKEKNLLSLSYGKIKRRDFDTSFGLLPESFETYQIIEAGNIILRLTDLQNDQRSLRVGLVREKGIITSAYLCLKFAKRIYPNFAYYLLHSYDLSKVFYWFGGGLRQSMKFDDIKVFPFTFPQYSEQKDIADYLDTKTAQIDQIIQTINTQIEKLQELRKTLINDVVTGKIKVIDN